MVGYENFPCCLSFCLSIIIYIQDNKYSQLDILLLLYTSSHFCNFLISLPIPTTHLLYTTSHSSPMHPSSFEQFTNYQFNMPSISWTRIRKYLLSWKANKLKDRKIQNSKLNLTIILQLSLSNLSFTWLQHSVATLFYFNTNISNPSPPSIALRLTNCYCIGSRQYHI
jgi:hypothetical protein